MLSARFRALAPIVLGLLASCAASTRPPPRRAAASEQPLEIRSYRGSDGAPAQLRGPSPLPPSGAIYTLVDRQGIAGVVRVFGPSTTDCDHCAGLGSDVELLQEPRRSGGELIALGPSAAPLARARLLEAPRLDDSALDASWRTEMEVDVDGDGRADLTGVKRCAQRVPSGCDASVCARICVGVRDATAPQGAVRSELCWGLLPDLEDCEPEVTLGASP